MPIFRMLSQDISRAFGLQNGKFKQESSNAFDCFGKMFLKKQCLCQSSECYFRTSPEKIENLCKKSFYNTKVMFETNLCQ
jgi:hypothetical protein